MAKKKKIILQGMIVLAILAAGLLGLKVFGTKKKIPKGKNLIPPLPVVEVVEIKTTPTILHIPGQGTVIPVQLARIIPEVAGKIVFISPSLVKGGHFSKGDTLLKIDPQDYRLAFASAKASLKEAQSNLLQIKETSKQAYFEWQLAHPEKELTPPPLAIKLPQLQAARAALKAAQSEVEKARLNLSRTVIKAPFSGFIQEKNVDLGQYVTPTQNLATLYGEDEVEVQVPLSLATTQNLRLPGFNMPTRTLGSLAIIRSEELHAQWTGRIVRSAAHVDEQTRMLDVYVRIKKPYQHTPPLAIGLFVDVEFKGPLLANACHIPASALHSNNTVWIVGPKNKIQIRRVSVAQRLPEQVLIANGLANGDRVITTPLAEVRTGLEVRIEK